MPFGGLRASTHDVTQTQHSHRQRYTSRPGLVGGRSAPDPLQRGREEANPVDRDRGHRTGCLAARPPPPDHPISAGTVGRRQHSPTSVDKWTWQIRRVDVCVCVCVGGRTSRPKRSGQFWPPSLVKQVAVGSGCIKNTSSRTQVIGCIEGQPRFWFDTMYIVVSPGGPTCKETGSTQDSKWDRLYWPS